MPNPSDSWFTSKIRTDTFFPIPYQKALSLHCDEAVANNLLLIGDRVVKCDPYQEGEGGFGYSNTPSCETADLRNWRDDVGSGVLVPITLIMEPIQIKTTTTPGSNELLSILLYTFTSKISVRFTDPMQYWVTSCTTDWVDFTCDALDDNDIRIWTFSRDINTSIKITCNEKVVVDFDKEFGDQDEYGTCKSDWFSEQDEDKFWIDPETTVSGYSLKADLTSWRVPDKVTNAKKMNLEKYPLQFKTDSALGSNASVGLIFENGRGDTNQFRLMVEFKDEAKYLFEMCSYNEKELDLAQCYAVNGKQDEIIWTMERFENTVLVFCNGVQIIDYEELAGERDPADECDPWSLSYARRLRFESTDDATTDYRFMPKSCDSIPADWTGVTPPPELPVTDGTVLRLSCVSDEEVVAVSRVVTCNPRYPEGFQYQAKPVCIRADGEVTLEPKSPIIKHDLTNSILITCRYFGLKEPDEVKWYKGSETEDNIIAPEKYTTESFDSDTYKQNSVLKLENISVVDSGGYICKWIRTSSNVDDVSETMTIHVRTLQMTQEAKSYSTDGSINLECAYSGKSQGSLKWFHKSDEILTGGKNEFKNNEQKFTLDMKDVSVELNAGKYKCVWSDDWSDNDGDRIEAETEVVVRTGVIVSDLSNDGQPYKYVEGEILELQCQFEGDIEPKAVVWQNGGSDINIDGVTNIIFN
ncbi:uncharacterized protein LOC134817186 [Bolinopsis microptera]|uniref:uncharacterized protein LOC134817186 n=1 Tax=Bolinopsis microptera TaxID=2820187 RepID=UPI0030794FC0